MARLSGLWLAATVCLTGCQSTPTKKETGANQPTAAVHLDPKSDAIEAAKQLTKAGFGPKKPAGVAFYLYFKDRAHADKAATEMAAAGYKTDVHQVDPTSDWTCVATKSLHPGTPEFEPAFAAAADVAVRNGGEYDGWEAALD